MIIPRYIVQIIKTSFLNNTLYYTFCSKVAVIIHRTAAVLAKMREGEGTTSRMETVLKSIFRAEQTIFR